MMAIGAVVNVLLAVRSRTIGGVTFEAHTMLYAAVLLIIGYQGVIFAAGARLFAITEGLLPADERWSRLFRFITLEVGIVIGVLCSAIGLAGSIYALLRWGDRSFGPFSYANTLRFVIPSATLLAIGSQTVLASFFLSILGLRRR